MVGLGIPPSANVRLVKNITRVAFRDTPQNSALLANNLIQKCTIRRPAPPLVFVLGTVSL